MSRTRQGIVAACLAVLVGAGVVAAGDVYRATVERPVVVQVGER